MTDEVDWVLDQFGSVVGSLTVPLRRVDRDNAHVLDGGAREKTSELQQANFVSAAFATETTSPTGTEYDHELERVVDVRVEGAHYSEMGHIDPDGVEGIAFRKLVRRLRSAVHAKRTFPDAGPDDTTYTHLETANGSAASSEYMDYYRYDFDVVFSGFESL